MNKKKWMIICCLVLFVSFFGVKKLNRYYKEFMLEYRIASAEAKTFASFMFQVIICRLTPTLRMEEVLGSSPIQIVLRLFWILYNEDSDL